MLPTSSSQTKVSCSALAWKRHGKISSSKGQGTCASPETQRLRIRLEKLIGFANGLHRRASPMRALARWHPGA